MSKILAGIILSLLSITLFTFSPSPVLSQTPSSHFELVSNTPGYLADVAVSGNLAYTASWEDIFIYDISDPANLGDALGSYHAPGCFFWSVDVWDNLESVAQANFSCSPRDSLFIFDVTNPENPFPSGQEVVTGAEPGGAGEIDAQDGYVYLAFAQGGLRIVKISDSGVPGEPISFTPEGVDFRDVKAVGNTLYLTDVNRKIWTLDITNRLAPSVLDTLDFSSSPSGVAIQGDYAYVTVGPFSDTGEGALRVVNVSDPSNIFEAGFTPLPITSPLDPPSPIDVEVSGNFAFVADDAGELLAFDISTPETPRYVTSYHLGDTGNDGARLTIKDDLIFVAGGAEGLTILRFTGLPPAPPTPFLDLPWDYEGKGMSFSEAATAINAYFDHQYPLLSSGISENPEYRDTLIPYLGGEATTALNYSGHDGYDYGSRLARLSVRTPVLAAAVGCASYRSSTLGGNTILIDHGNGYQTRYLHLLNEGLVTKSSACTQVQKGQQIGRVGYTGNVIPKGERGAHLHFMVVRDKDRDGNFDNNIPDGVVDPFGWQGIEDDPWPNYGFFYNGGQRIGSTSYYLWTMPLASTSTNLTYNGGYYPLEKYIVSFPPGSTVQTLNLKMNISQVVKLTNQLNSIGPSLVIAVSDLFENSVTSLLTNFTVTISFKGADLTRYKPGSFAIYSSNNGITWTKENTVVDFNNYTASTNVNRLGYLALIAERVDITSPVTTVKLNGQVVHPEKYKSDTQLILESDDSLGGVGVDYTLYKVNDEDWLEYLKPITFSDDGHYKIDYYSVDKDENIEEIKTIKFKIDK